MGEASRRKKEGRPSEPSHKWLRSMLANAEEQRDLAQARYHHFKEKAEKLLLQIAEKESADAQEAKASEVTT